MAFLCLGFADATGREELWELDLLRETMMMGAMLPKSGDCQRFPHTTPKQAYFAVANTHCFLLKATQFHMGKESSSY